MKTRPNYKYKIFNAEICARCEAVTVKECRTGFRVMICGKCAKELQEMFRHWDRYGMYLTERKVKSRRFKLMSISRKRLTKKKFEALVKIIKDDLNGNHKHEYCCNCCIWCGKTERGGRDEDDYTPRKR